MGNPTFEQIMLLLTTALGLSFMVERVLEMLNGLIKKTLLADDSPFSEEATADKPVATELEIEKMNEALDEEAEALAEKKVELAQSGLSDEEKAKREAALEEQTLALASRLANGPTVAYRYMPENINRALTGADMEECLDLEATHHVHTGRTEDHREAARAFVEKRTPVFKGR